MIEPAADPLADAPRGRSTSPAADAAAQAERLHGLGDQVRHVEEQLNVFELRPLAEPVLSIVPSVLDLASETRRLFADLFDVYDDPHQGDDEVAGVLFYALHEVRSREASLRRAGTGRSPLELIAACGSVLRNLNRTLTAVHLAICERRALTPTMSLERELAIALEVRAAYTKFRMEIEEAHAAWQPDEREPGPALLRAATTIAKLTGRDIFSRLRLQDRIPLRNLQERILAWRTSGAADPVDARRLWQDLYAFTQLLQGVNQRQELLEHDRRCAAVSNPIPSKEAD